MHLEIKLPTREDLNRIFNRFLCVSCVYKGVASSLCVNNGRMINNHIYITNPYYIGLVSVACGPRKNMMDIGLMIV